jgi:hypothetical protein
LTHEIRNTIQPSCVDEAKLASGAGVGSTRASQAGE